jgi:hypothetical protein
MFSQATAMVHPHVRVDVQPKYIFVDVECPLLVSSEIKIQPYKPERNHFVPNVFKNKRIPNVAFQMSAQWLWNRFIGP